ncbi:tetratricopeptide repeat protein [Taklimakanibacter deserti]|uniref:tetratricopeptide repeat protein n=1 Tax=Taklimakanibacter deserti TaxID=2267839 RepID=UPI0013C5240C
MAYRLADFGGGMKRTLLTVLATIVGTLVATGLAVYTYLQVETDPLAEFERVRAEYVVHVEAKDYAAAERVLLDAVPNPALSQPFYQVGLQTSLASLNVRFLKNREVAERHYRAALAVEPENDTPGLRAIRAALLLELGMLLDESGRYDEALEYLQQSLRVYQEIGDPTGEQKSLLSLGLVYGHLGDFDRGKYHLEEVRKRAEAQEPADPSWKALVYNNLAWMYRRMAQYDEALRHAEKGLAIAELLDDKRLRAALYDTIAQILLAQSRFEAALSYSEKSLAPPPEGEYMAAANYRSHGWILVAMKRNSEACTSFARAMELYSIVRNEKERLAMQQEISKAGC